MKEDELYDIELRSEEVQEVLNHIPSYLVRWGISITLGIIIIFFLLGFLIRYPDVVPSHVTLVTENPPVHLIARSSGQLELLKADKDYVAANTVVGVIQNSAHTRDVQSLSEWMDKINETIYTRPIAFALSGSARLRLGELQESYERLCFAIEEVKRFDKIAMLDKQRLAIIRRVEYYKNLNGELQQQHTIVDQELILAKLRFQDDSALYHQGAKSKHEMFQTKTDYLLKQRAVQSIDASLVENNIKLSELTFQAEELQMKRSEIEEKLSNQIIDAYEQLQSDLEHWKNTYLLISPIDGNVSLSKFWSSNQFVREQEEVLSIAPNNQVVIGKIELPVSGSGKVEINQKVRMKIDNYPYHEYGMIIGKVESISTVPMSNTYSISVSLPQGLLSTYHKQLEFKQEMSGRAEIITHDQNLIERIFYQLLKLIHQT